MPEIELIACKDTSEAVSLSAEISGAAAIVCGEAGRLYDLELLAPKIQDFTHSISRYLVIGKDKNRKTKDDKTSFMFASSHVPGMLHKVLQPIADAGLNMEKIESRPTRHEHWSHFFFVDVNGHVGDELVKETIERIKPLTLYFKSLGSYPRAEVNSI